MTQNVLARGGDWVPDTMDYTEYHRSGYRFALRYVVPSIPGKMVSAVEVSHAHAAGIDVGFIYETTGTTWEGGMTAGIDDGIAAQEAMKSINAPMGIAVYHAVDSQVADAQLATVIQWVNGLQKGMPDYRVGVYGQFSVMQAVAERYPHICLWQTPAWSDGKIFPALEMFQEPQVTISGITLDTDSLYDTDAGLWRAAVIAPPPPPKGSSVDEIISQAEWRYCDKCKGLFYGPEESSSKCPDGGTHDGSRSGNYVIQTITGTEPVT